MLACKAPRSDSRMQIHQPPDAGPLSRFPCVELTLRPRLLLPRPRTMQPAHNFITMPGSVGPRQRHVPSCRQSCWSWRSRHRCRWYELLAHNSHLARASHWRRVRTRHHARSVWNSGVCHGYFAEFREDVNRLYSTAQSELVYAQTRSLVALYIYQSVTEIQHLFQYFMKTIYNI
jgi:hypothetical protein